MKQDYKLYLFLSVLLIVFSAGLFVLMAQTTMSGANVTGARLNNNDYLPIQLGVDGWWKADEGIILSGTNVVAWNDKSGKNRCVVNYQTTNAPVWSANNFTNSGIPSVQFTVGPPRVLREITAFATNYAGEDVPFTTVWFGTAMTNSPTSYAYGFGWTAATNGNASIIGMTPGRAGTAVGINHSSNTNSNASVVTLFVNTGINTTNQLLRMVAVRYTGTQGQCFANLVAQTNQALDQTTLTVNTFVMGGIAMTNGNINGGWTGNTTEIQHYPTALSGSSLTNIFQDLTNRWYGGKRF